MPLPCDPAFASCYGSSESAYTNAYSSPVPAAEPDKTSRLQSIFQGITGVLTSASDVYTRLKYNPNPANVKSKNPRTSTIPQGSAGTRAVNRTFAQFNLLLQNNPLLVGGLVIIGAFLLFRAIKK